MEKVKINNICNISNGYAFKSDRYVNEDGARVIRITNVQKGQIVDNDPKLYPFSELDKLDAYKIYEGDILMSLTGNVGRVGRYPKELLPAYINQRVCRVMPKSEKLDTNFLFHFLNSDVFEKEAIKNSAGAAQLNLSTKWLGDFEIPLPPFATQQKIAAILDKASAIVANNRAIVNKYDDLTQSLFLDMFGDPVKNEKGWEKIRLGELGNWKSGGTPSRRIEKYFQGTIPWISSGELNEMYIDKAKEYITEEAIRNTSTHLIEVGSLLLGMYDTAALKSSINTVVLTCNQAIAFAKLNETVNTLYVYYVIQYGKEHYKSQQRGVRQKNLNLSMIKDLKINYPPIELQNQFAERVAVIELQKQQAQLELAKSESLFNSLLQRAFKGELS